MEIIAVILAVITAFVVLRYMRGPSRFVVLGIIVLLLFYFMTSGFGI